jgi:hypothetical protein
VAFILKLVVVLWLLFSTTPRDPTPTPTPYQPEPFGMDLYRPGVFVEELQATWCVPAAMQTSINIMSDTPDTSEATQRSLYNRAVAIAGGRRGGAEPEGWAGGLNELGYGPYVMSMTKTMAAAVHEVAYSIRLTGRPAGLIVWTGWHSWVVSGFEATADPRYTDTFTVTGLYIEDVWYDRVSSIWSKTRGGHSRPPDSLVPYAELPQDYLTFRQVAYPDKVGKYVFIEPVLFTISPTSTEP